MHCGPKLGGWVASLVVVATTVATSPSSAQELADAGTPPDAAGAELAIAAAKAAYAKEDYATAAEQFARAYSLFPEAKTRLNEAWAWRFAGDAPRAADAFDDGLRMLDDPAIPIERREIKNRERPAAALDELRQELGFVELTGPAGATVTVAHRDRAALPLRVHLQPGSHEVEVQLGESVRSLTFAVTAGSERVVDLQVLDASEPPGAPPPPPPQAPDEADRSPWEGLAVTSFSLAAVAVGVTVGNAVRTASLIDELESTDLADNANNRALQSDAELSRVVTYAAGGAAIAFVATGVLLWVLPEGSTDGAATGVLLVDDIRLDVVADGVRLRF